MGNSYPILLEKLSANGFSSLPVQEILLTPSSPLRLIVKNPSRKVNTISRESLFETVAAQNFCQKISKLLSKLSGKYFPALTQQNRDLNAINDNGAIKGMDAREDGVYITYVPSSGADSVTKKLGSEPQLLGTLTGNGTFDCKKIANYKQLTKDNFFIIPKTVRARFNAPRGTDSSNMGWNSTKELKSIEYNADTGILSFYLTTSDSYSYGSYWTKSYSIDITGDLYCVF